MKEFLMKKVNLKKIFVIACVVGINTSLFSASLKNGIYKFNYERMLKSLDVSETYKAFGIDAFQDILKSATGAAVQVKDSKFIDPESGVELKVAFDGKVSSPDNPSIQGSYKNDEISFFGFYEENNQTIQITLKGTLEFYNTTARAVNDFDGTYKTTDLGTGRKQIAHVKDGMYMWEYEDQAEDGSDFAGWPMIIERDGSFYFTSEYTTRSVMKGFSEIVITNKTLSRGKLEPNGSISIDIISTTNGTGMQENQTPYVFTGSKASGESDIKSGENIYTALEGKKKGSKSAMAMRFAVKEKIPDWYKDNLEITETNIYACGKKTAVIDLPSAAKLAESVAINSVRSYLGTQIKTSSYAKSENGEKYLYKTMDSLSEEQIDYEIVNQFLDESTNIAYVKVKVLNTSE